MTDFGSFAPSDGFDYTALMPGLGALAGFGAAAQTSRLPISNASLLGSMAGGLMQGFGAQRQAQIQQQQLEAGALQLGMAKRRMNMLSQLFGSTASSQSAPSNGAGFSSPQSSQPQAIPLAFKAAAQSVTGGPASGGNTVGSIAPTFTLPFPNATPLQNAVMMEMLVPGSGKGIVDRYFQGPTDTQRALSAANVDPRSPVGQRLLAFAADKAAGVASGYEVGQNGQMQPIAGGSADPHILGEQASAQEWGKAPGAAWLAAMTPKTLRGPGSVYVNPYFGQTVQIPNEINEVDPQTLAQYKKFVPLGLTVTGKGPLSSAAGQPQGASGTGGLPPQEGEGGTSFMTEPPPGQHKIVEGAAQNYTEEGRKSYESAVDLKGSIAFIKRDLETLGPQGFVSMGSGANARGEFARMLNSAFQAAGQKAPFDPNKVGAWEDFEKESTLGGMKGLATIFGGSREAASIIKTSMGAFPHPGNSYAGARLLVNAFDEAANREIDQRNFETNWIATHGGNLTGALEAFNSKYPAGSYSQRAISSVQPVKVTKPDDIKSLLPGTRVITPDGKVRLIPGAQGVQLQMQTPNG